MNIVLWILFEKFWAVNWDPIWFSVSFNASASVITASTAYVLLLNVSVMFIPPYKNIVQINKHILLIVFGMFFAHNISMFFFFAHNNYCFLHNTYWYVFCTHWYVFCTLLFGMLFEHNIGMFFAYMQWWVNYIYSRLVLDRLYIMAHV